MELEIDDLSDAVAEEQLRTILRGINGVHTARITQSGVHIIYNPSGVTPGEIARTVQQAGFTVDYHQVS